MSELDDNKEGTKKEEAFDIIGLLLEFLAQWKWFALSFVVVMCCAYWYVATIIPTYEVGASIYLSDENASSHTSSAVAFSAANPLVDMKQYIDATEIEVLKSRNSLIRIVDSLDLAYSYSEIGRFREIPIYGNNPIDARLDDVSLRSLSSPIVINIKKNDKKLDINVSTTYRGVKEEKHIVAEALPVVVELSHGTLNLDWNKKAYKDFVNPQKIVVNNPNSVAARLSGSLKINFAPNSYTILRVVCVTKVIPEGVDVINSLIDIYNQDILEDKNRSALQTEAFILERLAMISGELQDVEKEVQDYRREKNITDISAEAGMYLSQTNETDRQLAELEMQIKMVNEVESRITAQDNYASIPQAFDDSSLGALIDAYNKKLAQRAHVLEGSTEDNPIVRNMQDDLARQRNEIYRAISNYKQNLNMRSRNLKQQDSRLAGKISNIPVYERELTGIFREQRVKDEIYTFLLQKREEIAIQKTLATPTARLIDNPLGYGPIAPQVMTIYGVAFIFAVIIPALIIFLRRLLFPIFKDKEDLEKLTKVSILGEICEAKESENVVKKDSMAPIAELFRLVRNNVQFTSASNAKKQVILVTSSLSGEGKTFVALNLAKTYALTGKKTIVVGLDIRRPVLAHRFGLRNKAGVTNYLSDDTIDLNSLIHTDKEIETLDILPAGPIPPNPNELLLSERMVSLIADLRSKYDHVILDTAPIGVVSDTYLISSLSDVQLYVARANYSTKRCLKTLHSAVESGRLANCYLVLNGVDMRSNRYVYRKYGYYGYYGSGKKNYGYGYYAEKPTGSLLDKVWKKTTKS